MNNLSPAGFLLRLMATLDDGLLFFLPTSIILFLTSKNNTLSSIWQGIVILLTVSIFVALLRIAYDVIFTHLFGGGLGKLLMGLRVTDQSGRKLTLSKVLFRQLISYLFSMTLFGLGFLSILKDPKKQAWHDKTVNSNVFKTQPLIPLGLISLVALSGIHIYLLKTSFDNFSNNSAIKLEVANLATPTDSKQELTSQNIVPTSIPSPVSSALNYTQQDVDDWKAQADFVDKNLESMKIFINNPQYDQTKIQRINFLLTQMKSIAGRIYNKMLQKQPLTAQDEADLLIYANDYTEEQKLAKELFPQN